MVFDGTNTYITPSSFYYYGITATANIVAQLNADRSGPYCNFLTFLDPIDDAGVNPENGAPVIRKGSTNALTWLRNNLFGPAVNIPSAALIGVFSTFDGYYNRFIVDGAGYSAKLNLGRSDGLVRYQFNAVAIGGPRYDGAFAEAAVFGYSTAYKTILAIGNNQYNYFGTTHAW
jgi:hypothetical protein